MKTFIQHLIVVIIVLGLLALMAIAEFLAKKHLGLSLAQAFVGALLGSRYDDIKQWLFN